MRGPELESSSLRIRIDWNSCERVYEPSFCIQYGELIDNLSNC